MNTTTDCITRTIDAMAHSADRWPGLFGPSVRGHMNGVDFYGHWISQTDRRATRGPDGRPIITDTPKWSPLERAALDAMAQSTPTDRALALSHGDPALTIKRLVLEAAEPDLAHDLWCASSEDDQRDGATQVLTGAMAKMPQGGLDDYITWALSHDADANAAINSIPVLLVAAQFMALPTIDELLEHGADASVRNSWGHTAQDLIRDTLDSWQHRGRNDINTVTWAERAAPVIARLDRAVLTDVVAHQDRCVRRSGRRM